MIQHPPPPPFDPLAVGGAPAASAQGVSRLKPINPIRLLKQYWWLLVLALFAGMVIGLAAYLYLNSERQLFRSSANLLIRGQVTDPTGAPGDAAVGTMDERNLINALTTQASIISSDVILDPVLRSPEVRNTQWFQQFQSAAAGDGMAATVATAGGTTATEGIVQSIRDLVRPRRDALSAKAELRKMLSASPRRNTALLDVSVTTENPRDAQIILAQVIDRYMAFIEEQNSRQGDEILAGFRRRSDEARRELEARVADINNFRNVSGVSDIESRFNDTESLYQARITQRNELMKDLSQVRAYYDSLRSQAMGGVTGSTMQEIQAHPAVADLDARVRQLRQNLQMAHDRYGPQHRHTSDIRRMIEVAESERRRKVDELARDRMDAMIANASQSMTSLQQTLAELEAGLPELEARRREITSLRQEHRRLELAEEEARLRWIESREPIERISLLTNRPDFTRVVRLGAPTEADQVYPRPIPTVGISVFLCMALVGGLVVLRELFDQRIRGSECIKSIPNSVMLGLIPDVNQAPGEAGEFANCFRDNPSGMVAESIRQLRTKLNQRLDQEGIRSLIFVSAHAGGGTSSLIANLARAWAVQGRRVLVIDGNLRRPGVDRMLLRQVKPDQSGLLDVLSDGAPVDDAIVQVMPDGQLDMLTAGRPHEVPTDFFERADFKKLLEQLERRYDLILIDVAPGLITSDAQLIARSAGGVVLLARAVSDQRGMFSRLLQSFQGQSCQVLGVVLNGARLAAGGYFRDNFKRFSAYQSRAKPKPVKA
ncbi:MAG: hypothetical protein JJU36_14020 [Phycisphaeraceae bacterium]|nr:hypothetical protein [Phycisphaeraceae bacterium]